MSDKTEPSDEMIELRADIVYALRTDHGHTTTAESHACYTCNRRGEMLMHVFSRWLIQNGLEAGVATHPESATPNATLTMRRVAGKLGRELGYEGIHGLDLETCADEVIQELKTATAGVATHNTVPDRAIEIDLNDIGHSVQMIEQFLARAEAKPEYAGAITGRLNAIGKSVESAKALLVPTSKENAK